MDNEVFNPFRIFDQKWGRVVLPYILLGVLAILLVLSIVEPMFPAIGELTRKHNIYVIGLLGVGLVAAPLVFYWLSLLTASGKELTVVSHDTEEQAIHALFHDPSAKHSEMDVCCYNGATFIQFFSGIRMPTNTFGSVRVLVRHPGAGFRLPSDKEREQAMRQRIRTNIDLFQQVFQQMSQKVEVRGYSSEPSLRALILDKAHGFFAVYTTNYRITSGRNVLDYVTRDKPVFEFNTLDDVGKKLHACIAARFEDMWNVACPIFPRPILVFDFDGTLFDSYSLHLSAWEATLRANGITSHHDQMAKIEEALSQGLSADQIADDLAVAGAQRASLIAQKRRAYDDLIRQGKGKLYDDVSRCIRELKKRGYRLGIATMASRNVVERILENGGLSACFESLVCREDVDQPKPSPAAFNNVCNQLRIKPTGAVMIGDSLADQMAAMEARAAFIMVVRPHVLGRRSWRKIPRPFETITDINDLLELFH